MERVYSFDKKDKAELEKILNENPYEKISFARVEYVIKEMDRVYLYINSDESFFSFAEEKLKKISSFKKEEEKEKEIIEMIKKEREDSISGFGGIFG